MKRALRAVLALATCGMVLAAAEACDSDEEAPSATSSDAATEGSTSVPGTDAALDARPPALGSASIFLLGRNRIGDPPAISVVTSAPSADCVHTVSTGACSITRNDCPPVAADAMAPRPTLGSVVWTGTGTSGLADGGPVPFRVTEQERASGVVLVGEEAVHLEVSGGDIPAFTDDLVVPLALIVTKPVVGDAGGSIEVTRGQALSLAWERGGPDVELHLSGRARRGDAGTTSFVCWFPTASGGAEIPASLFEGFDDVDFDRIYTVRRRTVRRGGYDVTSGVTYLVVDPAKRPLSFAAR